MEVTMFHSDNPKNKVVVTNDQQRAGYLKMGFVAAPENEKKNPEANIAKSPQEDAKEQVKTADTKKETK